MAAIFIVALMCGVSCGNSNGSQPTDAPMLNLMDRLSPADSAPEDAHFQWEYVTRRGLRRNSLVIAAPVCIHASLQGISGKATLKGWAAPVFNVGDGLQMNIFLRRNGIRHPVGGRYFDPGRKSGDRNWIPIEVPLEISQKDWLEIEISAGPQGNLAADWLALSSWGIELSSF